MTTTKYSVSIVTLGVIAVAATGAYGQCSNDAGIGDDTEGEACALDENNDVTNSGCNSSPPVFTQVALDGGLPRTYCGVASTHNNSSACATDLDCDTDGDNVPDGVCNLGTNLCEGPNEPSVNRRDTDWYLISQAELFAADTDNNGTVRIQSAPTGEAGLDLVTFLITVDDLVNCTASVLNNVGCWDSTGGTGQTVAEEVITISEHPDGVIVFVAPGLCTGAAVFDGFECSTGLNDYTVTISADTAYEDGSFTACGDPANPQLGPCNEANPGVGGCEDPSCCKIVCEVFNKLCCQDLPLGWIQQCADAAVDLGCAPEPGGPICIATGTDNTIDNYLAVCTDPYGSWSSDTFGGTGAGDTEWGDDYNPIGAETAAEASFSNGFFLFDSANSQRELLSNVLDWQQTFTPDASLERTIIGDGSLAFDENPIDGVPDRLTSTFVVTGAGKDLTFDLVQTIGQISPAGAGSTVAVLTQVYDVTNNSGAPASLELVRHLDLDLVWAGSTFADDSVGTGTNGNPQLGLYAFQGEQGVDQTYVTVATSVAGGEYYASKSGIQPPGGGPANGAGTDTHQWDSYGVPLGWENYVPGIGYSTDGESGPNPLGVGADGSIGISIPLNLAGAGPASTAQVTVTTTYGAKFPLGAPVDGVNPCPWDCEAVPDGNVGINDFLALLGQWTLVDTSCDFDGAGVGINDFLALLAAWGSCPGAVCQPDLIADGGVNILDFTELLSQWGSAGPADLNFNGIVDTFDMVLLILCWGECPCAPLGNSEIFDQIISIDVTDPVAEGLGLIVTHVYATGSSVLPGLSLANDGNTAIEVMGGTLFQHPAGSDTPPDSALCGVFPDLCYDTFVTNRYLVDDNNEIFTLPDFVMTATTIDGSWLSTPDSTANLAQPIPTTALSGVLIAQVTIQTSLGPSSVGYSGTTRLFGGINAGGSAQGSQSEMAFLMTGACCLGNGNCIEDVTIFDCDDLSGFYQGDDSLCTPNPCPVGACCLANGNCTPDVSMRTCENLGGTYEGDNSPCSPNPCPTGACCLGNGNCTPGISMRACEIQGGTYQGDNSPCSPNPCPVGACCLADGNCTPDISMRDCEDQGGTYQGNGSGCSPNPCPVGACCLADGNCTPDMSMRDCEDQGGTYQGDGSTCTPNPCPTGACCLPDGNCLEDMSMRDCEDQGGTYEGDGSLCTPNPCPVGACCLADGNCLEDMSMRDCEDQGGTYQGDGSTCTPNPCPIGACCLLDDSCIEDVSMRDCEDQGGTYQGDDSTCTPDPCPP